MAFCTILLFFVEILHLTAKLVKDPKNAKNNEGQQLPLTCFKTKKFDKLSKLKT